MVPNNNQPKPFNKYIILLGLLFADIITAAILLIAVINMPHTPRIVGRYSLYKTITIESNGKTTETIDPYKDYGLDYTVEFKEDGTGEIVVQSGSRKEIMTFAWTDTVVEIDMGSAYYGASDAIQTEKYELSEDGMEVCFLYEGAHTSIYTSTDTKTCFKRIEE